MSNVRLTIYTMKETANIFIPFVNSVPAGFPSPAADYIIDDISLDQKFILNKNASFMARVAGDSMRDAGIFDGDFVLFDRAVNIYDGCIAVCSIDRCLTLKEIRRKKDSVLLVPHNDLYKPLKVEGEQELIIYGVVTSIHRDIRNVRFN